MFVSDADFDFAAEQIKKVIFAPFEVTSNTFRMQCVIPSYRMFYEETGNTEISPN